MINRSPHMLTAPSKIKSTLFVFMFVIKILSLKLKKFNNLICQWGNQLFSIVKIKLNEHKLVPFHSNFLAKMNYGKLQQQKKPGF